MSFKPSIYQQNVFDFITNGVGNCVISASAGSGKSTTIVNAIKLIPDTDKCLFIAFNNSIVGELKNKLSGVKNVTVSTFHSLGYKMLRIATSKSNVALEPNPLKYKLFIKKNIYNLSKFWKEIKHSKFELYRDNIIQLTDLARLNLAQSYKEILKVSKEYNMTLVKDEPLVVKEVLEWGKVNLDTIDFTDMLWLPNELNLNVYSMKYDWIFADECQDFSMSSIQLFQKCLARGARFVCVGDRNQAIYKFAGSTEKAFDYLVNYNNTKVFDLPITYRCSENVVKIANTLVKDIYARNNAPLGVIKYNTDLQDIQEGDMVLCRNRMPLLKVYTELVNDNKKCYINGKDVGNQLLDFIKPIKKEIIGNVSNKDSIIYELYKKLFTIRDTIVENYDIDIEDATLHENVMNLYDIIKSIEVISKPSNIITKDDLIKRIDEIFNNNSEGICISTIHKAKGLEATNVFLYGHSYLLKEMDSDDQERNLLYVAYTRAKDNLYFLDEQKYPSFDRFSADKKIVNELDKILSSMGEVDGKQQSKRKKKKEKIDIYKNETDKIILDNKINTKKSNIKKKKKK